MKSPQHSSQRTGGAPPPTTGLPWIVGLVALVALAGGLWLRHALQSPPPVELAALPTHAPPAFQHSPRIQHRQSDPGFDSDDGPDMPHAQAPGAAGNAAPAMPAPAVQGADAGPHPKGPATDAEPDAPIDGEQPSKNPATQRASNGATLSAALDGSTAGANDTAPIIAQGIEVDQNAGATRFPFGAQLAYPDRGGIDPDQGTIAFWARLESNPETTFAGRVLARLQGAAGNILQINMGSQFIGLVLTNADGEQTVSYTAMPWAPGVWHYIATTWGESIMQLYVDGNLTDQESYAGTLQFPPDAPLYVGSQPGDPHATPPPGYPMVSLRAWNVFPQILDPDQVAALMMQTAPPT